MPVYVFQSEDGERVEDLFPISAIPDEIEVNGKRYVRIPTAAPYNEYGCRILESPFTRLTNSAMDKPAPHLYGENVSVADRVKQGLAKDRP